MHYSSFHDTRHKQLLLMLAHFVNTSHASLQRLQALLFTHRQRGSLRSSLSGCAQYHSGAITMPMCHAATCSSLSTTTRSARALLRLASWPKEHYRTLMRRWTASLCACAHCNTLGNSSACNPAAAAVSVAFLSVVRLRSSSAR
jgi:hypothetical protein